MSDLISRQAAIDALGEEPEVWTGKDEYAQGLNNQWHYDVNSLKALPSAQPEKRTEERTETHACDLIRRQDAIDVAFDVFPDDEYFREQFVKGIEALPPARPEIVRCKDCKHNPKDTWFECPMSHLSEKQRPETAWCWKGERRTDEQT